MKRKGLRARRAEEGMAKTLSHRGLEERHSREIQEQNAAHHKELQDLRTQAHFEIHELKYAIGQRSGDENQQFRQRQPTPWHSR